MSSTLIVGSVALDTVHTPSGSHCAVLGGSAVFGALAAAPFCPARISGVVGDDYPDAARQLLTARGICLEGLQARPGRTFHWEGRYSDDLTSRTTLRTELNVFADFRPELPTPYRKTPFVMLGNIHPTLQNEVLDQLDSPSLVVADTMNFWIDGEPAELRRLLRRIDALIINEEEARQLAGTYSILQVARALRALGPPIVIIKQGEYGALLFDKEDIFSAPAYPVEEVLDPTGAGDSFAGALLGYLAARNSRRKTDLRRAVVYGSAVASFCVEGISVDRLKEIDPVRIEERFDRFRNLAHFASHEEVRQLSHAEA